MEKSIVDRLDVEILHILSRDPKLSCREIAKFLDVSDRTVARRIARMESEGVILGYQLILNDYVKSLIYDIQEITEVKFSLNEWNSFEGALREMYSTAADVILFYTGKGIERSVLRDINTSKISVEDALSGLSRICAMRGWGNIRFEVSKDVVKADVKNLRIGWTMFKGILTGVLETVTGRSIELPSLTNEGIITVMMGGDKERIEG